MPIEKTQQILILPIHDVLKTTGLTSGHSVFSEKISRCWPFVMKMVVLRNSSGAEYFFFCLSLSVLIYIWKPLLFQHCGEWPYEYNASLSDFLSLLALLFMLLDLKWKHFFKNYHFSTGSLMACAENPRRSLPPPLSLRVPSPDKFTVECSVYSSPYSLRI